MNAPEIVLLGRAHSGKTHYAGQLYGRLRRNPGVLRLRDDCGTPADLRLLDDVLKALAEGRLADHTATATWDEIRLPLCDTSGRSIDLRWPDYGGEQINAVSEKRTVTEAWRNRLRRADGWLWMIRPGIETTWPDEIDKLKETPSATPAPHQRATQWDANALLVELLQILLHVAGKGTVSRIRRPRLAVLISCYDEIKVSPSMTPQEALAHRLPLVASFIQSAWAASDVSVWGVSSLGRALRRDSSDDTFIDEGPERQGWVIPPEGGERNADLGFPLAWLLGVPR